ncbi:MAG: radical SAM protein [Spirochaetes bacterium]|nr:radical SAM protein [Spirochaetota bacterium]
MNQEPEQAMGAVSFELGPIRPPSEAQSILLRLTRNCPWNRCAFCPVYKGQRFSPRSAEEVIRDIDAMSRIRDMLVDTMRAAGLDEHDGRNAIQAVKRLPPDVEIDHGLIRQVAFWMYHGMKSLFLQDADSLALKTERVVAVLEHARRAFPSIQRITSYARAKTISRKTPEELAALRAAGLDRIHIGMESGSDRVLEMVCKGVTQEEQIVAGKNVMAAGFELSEYYMPGLGGVAFKEENAMESAKVVNEVNPTFIRIRSIIPVPGTPLFELYTEKKWAYPTEVEKVLELRRFIESLRCNGSILKSDHIMNLLEDVEGTLPGDREAMLDTIDRFMALENDRKESFILGRRMGIYRGFSDYRENPEVERIKRELKRSSPSFDEAILELLWNYI